MRKKSFRGYIIREDNYENIAFQFNPSEWANEIRPVFNSVDAPGASYPEINYIRQDKRQIPITIDLDGYVEKIDVEAKIAQYEDLAKPIGNAILIIGSKQFVEPPRLKFIFGPNIYNVVCGSCKVKRLQFNRFLQTTVAQIDLELLEYEV